MKKTADLIKAATISRVWDRATGKFLGFGVKSNSTNDYYCVHCFKLDGQTDCTLFCSCEAAKHGNTNCCHVQAVRSVIEARKALNAEKKAVQTEQAAAVKEAQAIVTAAPIEEKKEEVKQPVIAAPTFKNKDTATLNPNQGFNLLKPAQPARKPVTIPNF